MGVVIFLILAVLIFSVAVSSIGLECYNSNTIWSGTKPSNYKFILANNIMSSVLLAVLLAFLSYAAYRHANGQDCLIPDLRSATNSASTFGESVNNNFRKRGTAITNARSAYNDTMNPQPVTPPVNQDQQNPRPSPPSVRGPPPPAGLYK